MTVDGKSAAAYRTISEVATELDLPQHVLRFWESKFDQISPLKRGGGRRYYRPDDVALLRRIKTLLHNEGYTIKGVRKLLTDEGRSKSDPQQPDNQQILPLSELKANHREAIQRAVTDLSDIRDSLRRLLA